MMTSAVDFPTWFTLGCYCGLACCMFAIAANALYTSLRRRGTTRQLAGAIVTCVISALLLLPALVWYSMRFGGDQTTISVAEIEVALAYVALFGWVLPLSVTTSYYLFALPRTSTSSLHIPRQIRGRTTRLNASTALNPPRHQPGTVAPYVFSEDTPWGWLVYRGGRFQGQRLALKRTIITIGRGEENDIWLDDDMASRNHAELAWNQEQVYVTDCDSLNGVLLNGRRIRSSALVEPNDLLEIGSQRFFFEKVEHPLPAQEQDDPLLRHIWHSSASLQTDSEKMPLTEPPTDGALPQTSNSDVHLPASTSDEPSTVEFEDTAEISQVSAAPALQSLLPPGLLIMRDGDMAVQRFVLDRPLMTIGRGSESDIVINDASISRRHAQILQQVNGLYVQDLASRNGTRVNDEPLHVPRLLQFGDIVCLGSVCLEYTSVEAEPAAPISLSAMPSPAPSVHGAPVPLRLPSKPKSM
ncbi:MAG: hypothetical protein NVS4B7_18350 [Ktedonobacteraceae bacterium]